MIPKKINPTLVTQERQIVAIENRRLSCFMHQTIHPMDKRAEALGPLTAKLIKEWIKKICFPQDSTQDQQRITRSRAK